MVPAVASEGVRDTHMGAQCELAAAVGATAAASRGTSNRLGARTRRMRSITRTTASASADQGCDVDQDRRGDQSGPGNHGQRRDGRGATGLAMAVGGSGGGNGQETQGDRDGKGAGCWGQVRTSS